MNVGTTRPAERLHGYASHRTFSAQPASIPAVSFMGLERAVKPRSSSR
ncbi:mCG141470, isoform CRA_c [Mus musculus]|nr:mCG141470, isoform CRA_c [Mus musculus]